MKRHRLWILVAALLALLAGSMVTWPALAPRPSPPPLASTPSQATLLRPHLPPGESVVLAAGETATSGSANGARDLPLGTDAQRVIDELTPLARAGDLAAACRIALERLACDQATRHGEAMLEQLQRDEQSSLARAPEAGTPALGRLLRQRADRLAELQIRLIERQRECSGLPETLRSDGIDWLRQSALAGHPESILRYALGQSLGILEGFEAEESQRFDFMGHPGFAAWQREAPSLLDGMLANGHPEAAFILALAYSDDATPLNGLIRDDPVEAAAMRLVLGDFRQTPSAYDPLRGLDGRQRRAAIARHAALRNTLSGRAMDRRLLNQGTESPWLALVPDIRPSAPPCRR